MFRDTTCGAPRKSDAGRKVTLAGWIHRRRDHGGVIFLDVRDFSGLMQVVFHPDTSPDAHAVAEDVRSEWVVQVTGEVTARKEGAENPDLPTGDVELMADSLTVLTRARTPPFEVSDDVDVDDNTRLRHRFVDLRRPRMYRNLRLRHRVVQVMRDYMDQHGFLEVETPILIKSTPEGARDFVVPSRLHPGKFYGLPQSPQQLKQILMVSGVDRYFQFARCFRDEDLRADRQPEHTQLDLEMSFAHQSDVLDLLEGLYTRVVNKAAPEKTVITPFPRLTYNEAMEKYATDKPDLRFGMEVATLTDAARESGFAVFKKVADSGGIVRAIAAPGCASYTRKQTDELIEFARSSGAQGLVPVHISEGPTSIEDINEDDVRSVIKSHVSTDTIKQFARQTGAQPGDLILIIAGPPKVVNVAISNLRNEMGKRLELADPEVFSFAFVTDFPLFEWDDEAGGWTAMHHVFSSPRPGDEEYLDSDPGKVVGQLYDLVCNGVELGSGSVRIHDPELQQRMFRLIGYSEADIEERFGHLLRAFEYGTPPHAGMGLGLDRVVMLLAGEDSLREVIAFPKTQAGIDPLFDAPGAITEEQLKELSIRVAESGRT